MDCNVALSLSRVCLCMLLFGTVYSMKMTTFYTIRNDSINQDMILEKIFDATFTSCQLLCDANDDCGRIGMDNDDGSCILFKISESESIFPTIYQDQSEASMLKKVGFVIF